MADTVATFSIEGLRRRFLRVKLPQKIFFTENLRVMIKAGLSLTEALHTLALQTEDKGFRFVITELNSDVEQGKSLSQALGRFTNVFEPIFINMIAAGEISGTLEKTLEQLTMQMRKDYELVSKVKSAMTYPIVVLSATMLIGLGMMIFVVPQILSIFNEMGDVELPLPTRMLIAATDILKNDWPFLIIGAIALASAFSWAVKRPLGKRIWHRILLGMPIIGPIIQKINLARFTRTLSALLRTDIPIVQGLTITSDIVRNVYYRDACLAMAEAVKKGETISHVLELSPKLFPPLVIQMTAVGERAGTVDQMLEEIAEFFEKQVDGIMGSLSSIIEPVLIIFLGGAVGGIALAIITPIYALTSQFGQ
ncbi:MAG: type II secretion system F family protein [Patescibacteria group bacterium]|jgi:type IV pilus assembly protein PilC